MPSIKRLRRYADQINPDDLPFSPDAKKGRWSPYFRRRVAECRKAYNAKQPFRLGSINGLGERVHYRGVNITHLDGSRWLPEDYLVFGYNVSMELLDYNVLRDDVQRWAEQFLVYDWCIGRAGAGKHLSVLFVSKLDCDAFYDEWRGPLDVRW